MNNSTLIGDSMEQIRPLTPPKELFYDNTYNVESDPEFKTKMLNRRQMSIDKIARRAESIASSDDEKGRDFPSRLSDIEHSDHSRFQHKHLNTKN